MAGLASGRPREALSALVAGSGRLLGDHPIGPDASELIHGVSIALALKAMAEQLSGVVFPHPTLPEAVLDAGEGTIHA